MSVTAEKIHPLDLLAERSPTMAERVLSGEIDFIDGVDACYSAAAWAGLIERFGDDLAGYFGGSLHVRSEGASMIDPPTLPLP